MKIAVMLSSYHPYFSAIGKCMRNLIQEFEKDHEVVVISNMNRLGLLSEDDFMDHRIIRIRTRSLHKRDLLVNELATTENLVKKSIIKLQILFLRAGGALKIIFSKESIQWDLCQEYLKSLSQIDEIDVLIPTCYPFEAIVAAQEYNNSVQKKAIIIPILFDKFSESPTLHRLAINKNIKYKNHLRLEEGMIQDATRVFFVDSWKEHIEENFKEHADKLQHIEHPLLSEINIKDFQPDQNDQYIDIVYAGVLDKKVRPPRKTLKSIVDLLKIDRRIRFHFYTIGNCGGILEKFHKRYPDNIFNHGYIESEEVLKRITGSDVLLSIGNTDISLIPSKIFEYMSIGKPILHFYSDENDRIIDMMKLFELAFCVEQVNKIEKSKIAEMLTFIRESQGKSKEFWEVREKFISATPEFVAKSILKYLEFIKK